MWAPTKRQTCPEPQRGQAPGGQLPPALLAEGAPWGRTRGCCPGCIVLSQLPCCLQPVPSSGEEALHPCGPRPFLRSPSVPAQLGPSAPWKEHHGEDLPSWTLLPTCPGLPGASLTSPVLGGNLRLRGRLVFPKVTKHHKSRVNSRTQVFE